MSTARLPAGRYEAFAAILSNPATHAEAKAIPKQGKYGRRRLYPDYMWVFYESAISVCGSARQVAGELNDPQVWGWIRDLVEGLFPDDPSMHLPAKPMRRHHYEYGRLYLAHPEYLARRQAIHMEESVKLALNIGLLDPEGPGSVTHPDLSRTVYGDGKVITPLFRAKPGDMRPDRRTGELVQRRFEPDASMHFEAGSVEAYGTKFFLAETRSDEGRVILDARCVPAKGGGGEAGVATESFETLAAIAPGIQAVVYDMAMRGAHIDRLLSSGLLPVVKVPAASRKARRGARGGQRVDKERLIEVKEVTLPDGRTEQVPIYAKDGAPGVGRLNDEGELTFIPIERIRNQRFERAGGFRWYAQYRLPLELGGGEITLRLQGNDEDAKKKLNRAENLRAIPRTDPDFARLYVRRGDAESLNRALEDTLYLNRAHSEGHLRQTADLLGFALMVNSLTLARHRAREAVKVAA